MTDDNQLTVVGIFDERNQAEAAMRDLHAAGFRDDDIGFAWRNAAGYHTALPEADAAGHEAAGNATTGAVTGGAIGGVAAAAASLLIPGIGPILGGGLLASVLGGAVTGAAAGGAFGALTSLGMPDADVRAYERQLAAGRAIVTVRAGERYNDAARILQAHGGYNLGERIDRASAGLAGTGAAAADTSGIVGQEPLSESAVREYAAHPLSAAIAESAVRMPANAAGTVYDHPRGVPPAGGPAEDAGVHGPHPTGPDVERQVGGVGIPAGAGKAAPRMAGIPERAAPEGDMMMGSERRRGDTHADGDEARTTGTARSTVEISSDPLSAPVRETDTQRQAQGIAGGYSLGDAKEAAADNGNGRGRAAGSGTSPDAGLHTDDVRTGMEAGNPEGIVTTTEPRMTPSLVNTDDGSRRALDAQQATGPYIDPDEDQERVGGTTSLAKDAPLPERPRTPDQPQT